MKILFFLISELAEQNPTTMKLIFKHDREIFSMVHRNMRRLRLCSKQRGKKKISTTQYNLRSSKGF